MKSHWVILNQPSKSVYFRNINEALTSYLYDFLRSRYFYLFNVYFPVILHKLSEKRRVGDWDIVMLMWCYVNVLILPNDLVKIKNNSSVSESTQFSLK